MKKMATFSPVPLVLLVLAFGSRASDGQENYADFSFSSDSEAFSSADESYLPVRGLLPSSGFCTDCMNCVPCPKCPVSIPPGYKLYKPHGYYKLHHESMNWTNAKGICEAEGGYLAVMDSKEEVSVLYSVYRQYKYRNILLGFFDQNWKQRYITVLDEPMKYKGWAPGQPDRPGRENCGSFWKGYGLNDNFCNDTQPFLCELYA